MQYYYGEQNILRALDEAQFWKLQETEHAGLVVLITPGLEPDYVQKLKQFGIEFSHMHAETTKYIMSITRSKGMVNRELKMQMLSLVKQCVEQSQSFAEFLTALLENSHAVQTSPQSQEVIRHIVREAQYFVGIDQLILGFGN